MRSYIVLFTFLISFILLINGCRPPELEQAVIDYNAGRYDNALEEVVMATEKYPENEEAWYYLGEIQGRKGMIKEMVVSFNKSLEIKNTFQAQIDLAKSNYYSKFYNDGVSSYNSMIKISDKQSPEGIKTIDRVMHNFTNALYIKNDYMANRLMAIAYQFKNDDENSLKFLKSAAEAAPDTVSAWTDLGYYYQRKKEFNLAAEQFKRGLETNPNDSECLIRYAESLDMGDNKDEAIEAYKSASERVPNEKAIPFNLGLLLFKKATGSEEEEAKKNEFMKEAVVYFEKAQKLDPNIKEIYDLLGTLLLQLGEFSRAKELLEQGVEIFPDSSSVWQNLSFLYAKMGDKKKAEEAFKRSKELVNE
jgi:tetratricopeptide (TPR) repeat protein